MDSKLTAVARLRLEMYMREVAIGVANFGLNGIEYFNKQFPDILKELERGKGEEVYIPNHPICHATE